MDTQALSSTRREFLSGTAAALGVAAFGLEAAPASAAKASAAPLSFAYWTGTNLVDARFLPEGDASLNRVRLTVHGHSGGAALRAINAHFPIAGHCGPATAPFHAWTAAAQTSPSSRFVMPVTRGDGILLSVLSSEEMFCHLRTDGASDQPKLRAGYYVLALGEPAWLACRFDPEGLRLPQGPLTQRTLGGFVPAHFGYRVLTVERA